MEFKLENLNFDERGLIPAVVQDFASDKVLMMAYMNKEALDLSIETGIAHYYSRSRQKLWKKGETSGHFQHIKSITSDCDNDTLLLKVEQKGVACHTGNPTCFFNVIKDSPEAEEVVPKIAKDVEVLDEIYTIISDRKINPREGSYTSYLFERGIDKILKKVGEESAEVIIAAKNTDNSETIYEVADLFYHTFVLLAEKGINPAEIYAELRKRR